MGVSGDILQLGVDVEANPDAAAQVDKVTAALGKFRAEAGALAGGSNAVGAQVNVAIGAFQQLGQTIDVTNARAVQGFAAVGDALASQLVKLGATDAELNRIGAAITRVQTAAGTAGLNNLVPQGLAPNLSGTSFATRRAADAVAGLSLQAQAGKVTMQGLAFGAGSVTTEVAALAGASIGAATGIGALVTIGFALVGVLGNIGSKAKTAEDNLKALREEAVKSASTEAIRNNLAATTAQVNAAFDQLAVLHSQFLARQAELKAAGAEGPVAALRASAAASQASAAVSAQELRIKALQGQQAALVDELNKKGFAAEKELTDAKIRFQDEAKEASIRASQGEFAARRAAANDEFENEKRKLLEIETVKGQSADAIAALERANEEQLLAIGADEAQKLAAIKLAADTKSIKTREETELSSNKTTLARTEADLQASLARRDITEEQFIAQRLAAQKATIQSDTEARLKAANDVLQKEREAAAATRGSEGSQKALDALQKFGDERERILAEQRQRIGAAENAANDPAARLADLQRSRTDALANLQSGLRETQALAESGAISEGDAQDRVIATYQATQVQLAALIIQYERLAAAQPNNEDLARTVQDLNTQYIELGNTIARLQDPFRELKDAAKSSGTEALAAFASGATRLFSQSHVEINALAGELSNAKFELNQLLAIPANERTSAQTARITEVRGEVENLTVSLNNSKQAITSWKTLFVDALQSVLDALFKVSSQAVASQLFSFLGGLFGGLSAPTPAFGTFNLFQKAGGGLITGPGGVDRVPGMLTAGEYVVNASSVRALGTDFMETINRAGYGGSGLALRRMPRHFADGGLVTRGPSADAQARLLGHIIVEASSDLVVRQIATPKGEQAVIRVVQRNPGAVASAVPR